MGRRRLFFCFLSKVSVLVSLALMTPEALATGKKKSAVPPVLEIEVLDPGVSPTGIPTAVTRASQSGEGLDIDIPPTVLVHKYYYSGNRNFQGPYLPGGPSIAVFNHPKSNEQVRVPVQLLPGSPRVHYTDETIEYEYDRHSVIIKTDRKKPVVEYRTGVPLGRRIHQAASCAGSAAKNLIQRTYLPDAVIFVKTSSVKLTVGAIGCCNEAGRMVATPIIQAAQAAPVIKQVQSAGELAAQRTVNLQNQRAARLAKGADQTVKTIR